MKRALLGILLALAVSTPVSATAFLRGGTIALDPATSGTSVVIDATATGLKGNEYIVVRLSCSVAGVEVFAQDQQGSPRVDPPVQWLFTVPAADCTARVWYATKSYGLFSPLTDPLNFTAG